MEWAAPNMDVEAQRARTRDLGMALDKAASDPAARMVDSAVRAVF
jgi:hypothetical protein